MRGLFKISLLVLLCGGCLVSAWAQLPTCPPRPAPGSPVLNPLDLYSQNGTLTVNFTLRNSLGSDNYEHYCYAYLDGQNVVESPTLRLNPGDQLVLNLTDRVSEITPQPAGKYAKERDTKDMKGMAPAGHPPGDPCLGGVMTPFSTNVHFHGLNVPPVCHQDEIVTTLIQATDPPFQYSIQMPANDQPGMYWYHPHAHGNTTTQVEGGAAGALILEGTINGTQGLPEHVLVIRQQFKNPNSWLPGPNQLTINFQPAIWPEAAAPLIYVQPGQPEFYRVANATTQAFLTLAVQFNSEPQQLQLLAIDGIPLEPAQNVMEIDIPPAGRAEFIVPGLPADTEGILLTNGYDSGPVGNPNNPQRLADLVPNGKPLPLKAPPPPAPPSKVTPRFAGLRNLTPTTQRNLYFSEQTIGSNGPTQYFVTVQGQKPKVYSPTDPPAIVTQIGAVEDWTIENHAGEAHAFHIHQLHFLVMAINGVPVTNPDLQDTITIPSWAGTGPYPNVTLRMDFRDPEIAGIFVYHCHILDHEDGGMMAKIQVLPAN